MIAATERPKRGPRPHRATKGRRRRPGNRLDADRPRRVPGPGHRGRRPNAHPELARGAPPPPTLPWARRDDLILRHVFLVDRTVWHAFRHVHRFVDPQDLRGVALAALVEAAHRLDPARVKTFHGFALRRIRGAILDELRRQDWLTRDDRARANALGPAAGPARPVHLAWDEPLRLRDGALASSLQEVLDDPCAPGTAEPLERAEACAAVRQALASFCPRLRGVLRGVYWEGLTLAEVGQRLGVTESNVSLLHAAALRRLRHGAADPDAWTERWNQRGAA